jgi:hypothetical protein
MGVMGTNRWQSIFIIVLVVGFTSSCANLQSVQDFGTGTSDFASSYDRVFSGSFDTCLSSAEIRNVIIELGQTPTRSPLTQLRDDKELCAPYRPTTEAFNETSLALDDFGQVLQLAVKHNEKPSFKNVQFIPQFMGINESIVDTVPELRDSREEIQTVNIWEPYFLSFFAHLTPQEVILGTEPQVQATLNLLTIFTQIYQTQLDNYERNIKVLDTLIYDTGSSDALKRTFVINRGRDKITRQELLNNYITALNTVKESYKRIYQRSQLSSPHYGDPIFRQEMADFLINIRNLVQQSKLISQ